MFVSDVDVKGGIGEIGSATATDEDTVIFIFTDLLWHLDLGSVTIVQYLLHLLLSI